MDPGEFTRLTAHAAKRYQAIREQTEGDPRAKCRAVNDAWKRDMEEL